MMYSKEGQCVTGHQANTIVTAKCWQSDLPALDCKKTEAWNRQHFYTCFTLPQNNTLIQSN